MKLKSCLFFLFLSFFSKAATPEQEIAMLFGQDVGKRLTNILKPTDIDPDVFCFTFLSIWKGEGCLVDGTVFDSSYARESSLTFPIDKVIAGLTEALKLMPVGSKWEIFIPSGLAYGAVAQEKIPANSVLIFKLELLCCKEPQAVEPS